MHELIVSPFLGNYIVVRPGRRNGMKISYEKYQELTQVIPGDIIPAWLAKAARHAWDLDLLGRPIAGTVLARPESPFGYGRASYELNLGCNYDCEHCYLGVKRFEGLSWPDRERLLHIMRDAGVLWLQLTGGEPMIDRLFTQVYTAAYDLGMMLTILSNGSRLSNPRRKGAFRMFEKGLYAGHEAGLPLAMSMIVTKHNTHEVDQMRAIAERLALPFDEYVNMVPTIYGGAETLPSQSVRHLRKRKVFTGCNAGHTFFHVDPHGKASICKVGRDPHVSLMDEGVEGLSRLGSIADGLLLRQGGCTGCTLSGTCGTCMPLVQLYRKTKAPLATYCQHRERKEDAG